MTWEPNHQAISGRLPVQADTVEVTATTPEGVALFKGALAPAEGAATAQTGRPDQAVFEAPPGRVELNLAISADGRDLDTDVRHVEVPALDKAGLILMPAEVFRAFTAREYDALRTASNAPPVASTEFSRAARLLIRIRAYGSGPDRPVVTARLLNLTGQPMRALDRIAGPAGEPNVTQFDLPLSPFPPGDYTIEFLATSQAGQARSLLSIRIVS